MNENTEPEVFWCPICGKNVWLLNPNDAVDLICVDCRYALNNDPDLVGNLDGRGKK